MGKAKSEKGYEEGEECLEVVTSDCQKSANGY
jgi:hypothetical protein